MGHFLEFELGNKLPLCWDQKSGQRDFFHLNNNQLVDHWHLKIKKQEL